MCKPDMTARSDSQGPLARSVGAALDAAKVRPEDRGTAELARRYAALIDEATPASKYRTPLRALDRALDMLATFEPLAAMEADEQLTKIKDALGAHSVTSDLGPKLLAALVALGLTPPVARAVGRGVTPGDNVDSAPAPASAQPESEFERLRRERVARTRQHRA